MDEQEARAALAGVGGAQTRLAEAVACPPWRHAAFGAIMGGFVAAVALPTQWQTSLTVAVILATAGLAAHDRKRMGVFVNGYRKGRTRGVALVLLGAVVLLLLAQLYLRSSEGATVAKVALVLIAAAFATAASVVWQRAYVRDLTRGNR